MSLFEENIKQLREIVDDLYSYIGKVGAYSDMATAINKACSDLNIAINEYENQTSKCQ